MRKRVILVLLILYLPINLFAQGDIPITLSLEDAIGLAMSNNNQIDINRYNKEKKVFEKKAIAGLRSPQLSLSASYTYFADNIDFDLNSYKEPAKELLTNLDIQATSGVIDQLFSSNWSMTIQDQQFAVVGVSTSIPIFMGGKINIANRVAKIEITEKDIESQISINNLYREVVDQYYALYLAIQIENLSKNLLEGMKEHLYDAIALEKSGMIAKVERMYAQLKVSEAESSLNKATADVSTIRVALASLLGVKNEITPISPLFILEDIGNIEEYRELVLAKNQQLKQLEIKSELAKESVKFQRSDYLPELAAMGGYNLHDYQLTSVLPRWAVGVGLKFKIFNGLQREFKVAAAKSEVKMVDAVISKAEKEIVVLVEKQFNDMEIAKKSVLSQESTLEFAYEYLRVKEIAFKEGEATSVDVTNALLNLQKVKIEQLSSAYNFIRSLMALMQSCGDSFEFGNIKSTYRYRNIENLNINI